MPWAWNWIAASTRWTRPPSISACRCFPGRSFASRRLPSKCTRCSICMGNIPVFIHVSDGKMHDVNMLDRIEPEAGAFYVMDRAYIDFERLYQFTLGSAFFVTRSKSNILLERRTSHPVDRSTGVHSDQTVILTSFESASAYPEKLRRVTYCDAKTGKRLKFLTNNFTLPALTIAQIYKQRWQVEPVLQMDQTALAHQGVFRHQRERRQDPNLDRNLGLRPGRHRLQTTPAGLKPLPNPTDSECYPVRENPHFTSTSELQRHIRLTQYF